jgi:hypothetical protein
MPQGCLLEVEEKNMLKPDTALRKDRNNARQPVLEHRHYAVIAGIIRAGFGGDTRAVVANVFATHLADTNPKFDRARFMRACLD